MKAVLWLVGLLNCGLALGFTEPVGGANDAQQAAEAQPGDQGEEPPVVLVEAWRIDRAMDSFLRGDFATAEVEFKKNIRCIRRIELELDYAIRHAQLTMYRAAALMDAPGIYNLPRRPDEIRERTCHSKAWQYYMIGLSQIQLGRFDEAKKSLRTAVGLTKNDVMYDAYYRVGLLELMEGDVESADRRLADLVRMNHSCRARGKRCEVGADMEAATAYLTSAVAHARSGVHR